MSNPAVQRLESPGAPRQAQPVQRHTLLQGRHALAAAIAFAVHGMALLPLLLNGPDALSGADQPIMVGVMVEAPPAQRVQALPAVPAAVSPPPSAPAPVRRLPQAAVTQMPTTPRSIAAAPEPAPRPAPSSDVPTVAAPTAAPSASPPTTAATAEASAPPSTPGGARAEVEATEPPRYQAAYLDNPQPPYPAMSRKLREQGTVRLLVMVTADGRADTVKIKHGSGYERLDQAARAAVQEWRFVPARRMGLAIAGWVDVPIRFQLEN